MKLANTKFSNLCGNPGRFAVGLAGLAGLVLGLAPALAEPMPGGGPAERVAAPCNGRTQQAIETGIEARIAAVPEARRARLLEILNQGGGQDLAAIRGIASTRSAAIQAARPFASLADLLRVPGIGTATLAKILQHDPAAEMPVAAMPAPVKAGM